MANIRENTKNGKLGVSSRKELLEIYKQTQAVAEPREETANVTV